jgi:serine protease AprX
MNRNPEIQRSVSSRRQSQSSLKFVVTLGLLSVSSLIAAPKLSKDLEALPPSASVNVILRFTRPPSAADMTTVSQLGGVLKTKFEHLNGALVSLKAGQLKALAANSNITYISPDRKISANLEFAEPTVNANTAFQYGWTGAGIGVAVIDSGVYYSHPDLRPRVVYSQSFVAGDSSTKDAYGHGTHVAGIVGGNAFSSAGPNYLFTFRGIAPQATLINLRALDSNGQGTDSSVINAIERAIQLKKTFNIRVINLSLGRTVFESYTLDPLCQEVEKAWQAGLVVVAAAGNDGRDNSMGTNGYSTITAPGNDPYVITVGAMKDMGTVVRTDDLIASYSSKGPTLLDQVVKPDIVAPGNSIVSAFSPFSAVAQQYTNNAVPYSYYVKNGSSSASNTYFRLSGTSMATPMVSGAAALLLQQQPSLTPDQVKARLMKTATKNFPSTSVSTDPTTGISYTSTYDLFTIGAGYLDVWAALNNTDVATGSAQSPTASYDSTTGNVSVTAAPGTVWQDSMVWGSSLVWGSNVIVNDEAAVWGTALVWGSDTSSAFSVVWGSTVVWGSSNPFPTNVSIYGDE